MVIFRLISRPVLYLWYYIQRLFKTGTFGPNRPEYIKTSHNTTGNTLKDALHEYHVKQFHESSCSVASVACAVNALLKKQDNAPDIPYTQQDLLDRVRAAHWKERMSEDGYKGRRGLPLDVLGQVVKESLDVFGIRYRKLEIVQAKTDPAGARDVKAKLRSRLMQFEKQGDCLMIAHFDQGSVIPEFHIPHISPVGGFDPKSGKVTLLDVDPELPYPYRVGFETFYEGISTNYHHLFKLYGYGSGGYIFIQA